MRQLSSIPHNIFTVRLHDVVVVPLGYDEAGELQFDDIFLVQEVFGFDVQKLFSTLSADLLQEEHITTIIYNLLCAANFLHRANVVHRDLKSANVLIDENCNVKICDFGLSRTLCEGQSLSQRNVDLSQNIDPKVLRHHSCDTSASTVSNTVAVEPAAEQGGEEWMNKTQHMGSRFYRAPEIILCYPRYGPQIDIWGIGCIMGELMMHKMTEHRDGKGQLASLVRLSKD